ncbi:MAG TPA: PQQ-binding-like beta-propeller repeat protein [Thermoguttaceae bacterium]|nr:PQQ-binding-like beta-propeller repeat protein [Thermoguttaceae bacterium]
MLRRYAPAVILRALGVVVAGSLFVDHGLGADWPQWRYDARRTAASPEALPGELHLQWVRQYPALEPAFWQVRQERVQFDLGYEPVVAGKTLVLGSSRNDRVTALDTETGSEKWRFYADGPVRTAPAIWQGRVFFASDDGFLYCLDLDRGALLWKRRASPSPRKVLGNGRLISVWPARGGPVVADGRVYFAAGVWPFEGLFIQALDAATGKVLWVNDRCGSLYIVHPHGAMSFGGPSPQGYLLVDGDRLVVPSGRAFPAFFDRETGRLAAFDFGHGGHGSRPGAWFVAIDAGGQLVVDPQINSEGHDVGRQTIGQPGIRREENDPLEETVEVGGQTYWVRAGVGETITVGGKAFRFSDGFPGVAGQVHTMLAADGKLFVVTRSGAIHCFGPGPAEPKRYAIETRPLDPPGDAWAARVETILGSTGVEGGYAVVCGLGTGRLVEALIAQSKLHVLVIEPDREKVDALRRRLDAAGLYGERAAVHAGDPLEFGLPPYLAELVVSEDLDAAGLASGRRFVERVFHWLRPYGGKACLAIAADKHHALEAWCRDAGLPGAELRRDGDLSLLVRPGPLPGAADYTGSPNRDALVKAPLGLLWFGDTFHHHKLFYQTFEHEIGRGLPENIQVVDGVMRYAVTQAPYGPNPKSIGYREYLRFLETSKKYFDGHVDVYTGRVLSQTEAEKTAFPARGEPEPKTRGNLWTIPSARKNPLTGIEEGRQFLKNHGCDQTPVDYGNLFTMRSGTAAFYDKRLESGTINVSGIRSGCRNSLVPACGVLSLPSWTGNCTCNYPLYTSLALVPMPQEHEQWSAWGGVAVEGAIERVGINFGAPGDRATEDGTLWLDYPSVGGPSPDVPVHVAPEEAPSYYRHSLWIQGGRGWPWVTASGVQGVSTIRIEPVARRSSPVGDVIGIRWQGMVEPEFSETYTFHAESDEGVRLWIDGKLVVDNEQNLRRGNRGEVAGSVALEAGRKAGLKLEYYGPRHHKEGERGLVALRWSSPSVPKSVVPKERLFTADARPGGLTAAYYDTKFDGPAVLRIDPEIELDWGEGPPEPLEPSAEPIDPSGVYTVELFFAEPDSRSPGDRVFSVAIQGREVLEDFDVVREAGGPMRGVVKQFGGIRVDRDLSISFTPKAGRPLVCGVRLERDGPVADEP